MKVSDLVEIYLDDVRANRTASTWKAYRTHLAKFVATFGDRYISEIRPIELRQWAVLARMKPNGSVYAADTVRAMFAAVESFQSFAVANGELSAKITTLDKPTSRQRDRLPTDQEIETIYAGASADFLLIYRALRLTGARPGEMCSALIEEIQEVDGLKRIVIAKHKTVRKTGKPRTVPIGQKLGTIIIEAIGERDVGPIFLRSNGRAWSSDSLGKTFRRIRDAAGLPSDLCVYLARHEVATKLCQRVGIAAARDALNHSNIRTTSRYVKRDEQAIADHQEMLE